jgi:hypothetical protein
MKKKRPAGAGKKPSVKASPGKTSLDRSRKESSGKKSSGKSSPGKSKTASPKTAAVKPTASKTSPPPPAKQPSPGETTSTTVQPPPSSEPEIDPRLESFLLQAAPILSAERGINAKSRVLLGAVARDLGISDEEFEDALKSLQHGSSSQNRTADPSTDAFYRYLHARLEKFQGILTLNLQNKAVQVAEEKFQLSEQAARETVADVARELKIKRVTQADAERQVLGIIKQKVGDSAWIDDDTTERLRGAGRQWGLNTLEIDGLIRKHMAHNRESQRHEHRFVAAAAWATGSVLVVVLGLFVWAFVIRPITEGESVAVEDKGTPEESSSASTTVAPPTPPKIDEPADWWDSQLTRAQLNARRVIPRYDEVFAGVSSSDPEKRGKAYPAMVNTISELWDEDRETDRQTLQEIIAKSYAEEPDDEAAAQLREALVELTMPRPETLPDSADVYKQANWAVRTSTVAMNRAGISEERADALASSLGRRVGTTIDREAPRLDVIKKALGAVAAHVYQSLCTLGPAAPVRALELQQAYVAEVADYLSDDVLDKLRTDFLVAVLPYAGQQWRDFRLLIEQCIDSRNPINVLKVLEVYEDSDDETLQSFVGSRLLMRARAGVDSADVANVSAAVRKSLGVAAPPVVATAADRWAKLEPMTQPLLDKPPASPVDQSRLLEETIQLAWLATLTGALAQQEPGFPMFDQMIEEGRPSLAAIDEEMEDEPVPETPREFSDDPRRLPDVVRNRLTGYFDDLARFKEIGLIKRQNAIRGLASEDGARLRRIEPAQGEYVARYLLADKSAGEQAVAAKAAAAVSRWYYVRLALADMIEASPLPDEFVAEIATEALGSPVSPEGVNWRAAARKKLLHDVLLELRASTGRTDDSSDQSKLDVAAEALHRLYKQRSRQLRIDQTSYESTETPSQVLALLIAQTRSSLGGADTSWVRPRMDVIDYLADDDLQRTVALQRVWLKLLALEVRKRGSELGGRADELVRRLEERDQKASHLLVQLRDGEETTLRILLLNAPPGI